LLAAKVAKKEFDWGFYFEVGPITILLLYSTCSSTTIQLIFVMGWIVVGSIDDPIIIDEAATMPVHPSLRPSFFLQP
jgi:hypothetical protein